MASASSFAALLAACMLSVGAESVGRATPLTLSERQVGSFRFRADGSFAAAKATLGIPTRITPGRASGTCTARWSQLELTMSFYSLGITNEACGSFASAETTSRRFKTPSGLRVGARLGTLRRLYPRARLHRGPAFAGANAWWLVTRTYAVGPFRYATLFARVSNGTVAALGASYPSGGD